MLGAIIGDVVGSRFEFNNIKRKEFTLFHPDCKFTDDSVCTIAFMDWLLHAEERTPETATTYLRKWTSTYPFAGYGGRFIEWVFSSNPRPYNSYGNGSAMRISSIAWAANDLDELKTLSDMVTGITHNHPEGMKGALVVATCIYMALHGSNKESIGEYAISCYPEISNLDYEELRRTYFHGAETCQLSVPQALYCFLISDSFEDCLRTTISIGGDCDTTAAMSCAIAEAYYGITTKLRIGVRPYLDDNMKKVIKEFEERYGKKIAKN